MFSSDRCQLKQLCVLDLGLTLASIFSALPIHPKAFKPSVARSYDSLKEVIRVVKVKLKINF